MMDSYEKLKPSGDSHPERHQVCSLHQKELEIEKLTMSYSDTSAKLQDLSIVLDNSTLIAELKHNINIADLNVSSIHATMWDRGGEMLPPWQRLLELELKRPRERVS
jgi:hypothetical protein